MAIKQISKLAIVVGSLLFSTQLMAKGANSETSGFYGGIGAGGMIFTGGDYAVDSSALAASLTIGYEDMGWAIEGKGAKPEGITDSSDTLTSISLGYRSIEENGRYYKVKVGQAEFSDGLDTATVFGLGIGFRVNREDRIELEYELADFSSDSLNADAPVHMVTVNYLFGGATYGVRNYESQSPLYTSLFVGLFDPDLNEFDSALAYGIVVGYDMSKVVSGVSVEFEFAISQDADSVVDDTPSDSSNEEDEYSSAAYGLYAVYKTQGKFYIKGRVGFQNLNIEDKIITNGINTSTDNFDDSGLSYGLGAGYKFADGSRAEVDYTITPLDANSDHGDSDPAMLKFSYIF